MLYLIQAEGVGHIKIGFTADGDAAVRLACLQTGSPVPLRLLGTLPGTVEDEKDLHRRFAAFRVHGEWFRPVPELVALFAGVPAPECDGATVTEQSVSVRVLTVGRKQFSKAMLSQLPEDDCLCWEAIAPALFNGLRQGMTPKDAAEQFPLAGWVQGRAWGWVVGGYKKAARGAWGNYRYLVFDRDGRLFKQKDFDGASSFFERADRDQLEAFVLLYRRRYELPGWAVADQLFYGV